MSGTNTVQSSFSEGYDGDESYKGDGVDGCYVAMIVTLKESVLL